MKKIFLIFLIFFLSISTAMAFSLKKKEKPYLALATSDYLLTKDVNTEIKKNSVFRVGERIYFQVYYPEGFKSDYLRYQIVKQDDNAFEGGYNRIRNITCRLKDKHFYKDYFVLTQRGKYIIQIFDIVNLHQWVVYGAFLVVD